MVVPAGDSARPTPVVLKAGLSTFSRWIGEFIQPRITSALRSPVMLVAPMFSASRRKPSMPADRVRSSGFLPSRFTCDR